MTIQLRRNADELKYQESRPVSDAASDTARGGLARGTMILTAKGERAVEDLHPGDRIITRERGMARLTSIRVHTAPACSIQIDSLGIGRPDRATVVAADQHVIVRDWRAQALFEARAALVPTDRLSDGNQIAPAGEAEFYSLEFGSPLTVYANGLEAPTGRKETGVIELGDAD